MPVTRPSCARLVVDGGEHENMLQASDSHGHRPLRLSCLATREKASFMLQHMISAKISMACIGKMSGRKQMRGGASRWERTARRADDFTIVV